MLPRGTSTAQVRPALAAYAAALALVLPVDAQITAVAPRLAAMLTATVMPRSLNDPVGFAPSTFRYTSQPVRADSTGAGSSGVAPSASVITSAPSGTGSRCRYWAITPCHGTNEAPASAAGFTLAFNFMASLAGASHGRAGVAPIRGAGGGFWGSPTLTESDSFLW